MTCEEQKKSKRDNIITVIAAICLSSIISWTFGWGYCNEKWTKAFAENKIHIVTNIVTSIKIDE